MCVREKDEEVGKKRERKRKKAPSHNSPDLTLTKQIVKGIGEGRERKAFHSQTTYDA